MPGLTICSALNLKKNILKPTVEYLCPHQLNIRTKVWNFCSWRAAAAAFHQRMVKQLQILVVNETWKGEYVYIYIKYKSLVYVLLVIETWSSDKCKTQKSKNGGTKGSSINDLTHFWHLYFWHFFMPPPSPYYVTFNVRTPLPPLTKQKHF